MEKKKRWLTGLAGFCLAGVVGILIYGMWGNKTNGDGRTLVRLMEGTAVETGMEIIDSGVAGDTIMVIGGIHGDESSGWMAAEELGKKVSPEAGRLIVIARANAPGCRDGERNVETYRDLNRSFPGTKNRDLTDQLAAVIYEAVEEYSPDLVIDLLEAYREEGNRDFLGNSIIFTDISGMEDLVPDLIMETQAGTLAAKPFSYFNGAPAGSLNREVSEGLGIPVITIEASQEDPLEERIGNHLALVYEVMQRCLLDSAAPEG